MSGVRRLDAVVDPASAGLRLDRFLAGLPAVATRSQAKQLVDAARVHVDGVVRKASFLVHRGMHVVIDMPPALPTAATPEALPLRVLYEDEALIAIDKAPGMVVHPAPGARRGTLVNALLHRFGDAHVERAGIVHRLDKDTSGVLLVARTSRALEALARQFRTRTVAKRYLALVHGHVRGERGTIDRPIGRDRRARKRMSVRVARGRAAVTRWEVRERLPGATLLLVAPETGRTHQIRVHLASIGHPVVADRVYGGRRPATNPVGTALAGCPRQALHAAAIAFAHPSTGAAMRVEAPLPDDLGAVLHALRKMPTTLKNPAARA